MKASQAEQGIIASVQGIRAAYATSQNTGACAAGGCAALPWFMQAPGFFPVAWNGTVTNVFGNPWHLNPSATVGNYSYIVGDQSQVTQFGIELDSMTDGACVQLVAYFNKAAAGLNGGQISGLTGTYVDGTATAAAPPAGSTAVAAAADGPGWGNKAQIFKLDAQTPSGINGNFASPSQCSLGAQLDSFAVTFDMSKM
jgi:hypothetical protein